MKKIISFVVAVCFSMSSIHCSGPIVYGHTETSVFHRTQPTILMVNKIEPNVQANIQFDKAFFSHFDDTLKDTLIKSDMVQQIIDQESLDSLPRQPFPIYAVKYRILESNYEIDSPNVELAVIAVLGVLLVPLAFLGVPRMKTSIDMDIEMQIVKLKDVANQQHVATNIHSTQKTKNKNNTATDKNNIAEISNSNKEDKDNTPLITKKFHIHTQGGVSPYRAKGETLEKLFADMANELAKQVFASSADDIHAFFSEQRKSARL